MKRHSMIIAYDISSNKNRYQARKILKEWSLDNQKSVYECRLSKTQAEELFLQLSDCLDHQTDKLLMARIEPHRQLLHRGLGRNRLNTKLFIFR